MADRILTWFFPVSGERSVQSFYIEDDYEPTACRIMATAPVTGDLEVDIFDDGVSIFNNHASNHIYVDSTHRPRRDTANTYALLAKGDTLEDAANDFTNAIIAEGSILTCSLGATNGARNITVQLELTREDDE